MRHVGLGSISQKHEHANGNGGAKNVIINVILSYPHMRQAQSFSCKDPQTAAAICDSPKSENIHILNISGVCVFYLLRGFTSHISTAVNNIIAGCLEKS